MAGAGGGVDPGARPGWRWDVALSFAGAQRGYVEQVAEALKARGVRCFYDADEEIDLWGKFLAEELPAIYGEQAAAVVIFVSAEYAAQDWTRHERRAALARAVRERREFVLPARFDDTPLPGLLADVSYVDLRGRAPQQFAAMIGAKLASLGIGSSSSPGEAGRAPPGGIPVSGAEPRRLGVHAAISVPGASDDAPPEYVPRDADADGSGVRARVAAAAQRGGFILLVGGSSVGKTRCAVEAVRALLPDWWLVHPAGPDEVAALAAAPVLRMVIWLDELQRYLDGEHGLTGGVVRALLNAPHPVVIIGTLWPDRYTSYTAVPAPGRPDPYAREREVLDLTAVIRIGPAFSPAEQDRARNAAARDRRLKIALETAGYGLTQTLAAAPQLVARLEDAQTTDPYAWAVLTAALDAARLGARAPLSADLLRAAAPGYCTSSQQAEAPDNWFEQALAYTTGKLHGAVAALSPVGAGMGRVAGYTVADYLIQHASRKRRYACVPASTWDAVLSHIRDPADSARLADSARRRLLYCYAIPLYRHAADAGDTDAALMLADLLAMRGDLDGAVQILLPQAQAGDKMAVLGLANLLGRRGDLDEAAQILRAQAEAGDEDATWRLADLLAGRGDPAGAAQILRPLAEAGQEDAARRLTDLLAGRGDPDELRSLAEAGDQDAARRLTDLLAERGDLDGAAQMLRPLAATGDQAAFRRLFSLLAGHSDMNWTMQIFDELDALQQSTRADLRKAAAVNRTHLSLLATLRQSMPGDPDELRAQADELRARADSGDETAARRLADLLAERGDLDGLRARADVGDETAAWRLADLLAGRGDLDGAERILRARADAGDQDAARRLADLLAERGDLDGLRARADAGERYAAGLLADLLAERGDLDGLRARANAGDETAARRLTRLLAERGDLDGLRARANAGDETAAWRLATLLIKQGRGEEAERLRRFGLNLDGSIACA
jgi:hypothetical protein